MVVEAGEGRRLCSLGMVDFLDGMTDPSFPLNGASSNFLFFSFMK